MHLYRAFPTLTPSIDKDGSTGVSEGSAWPELSVCDEDYALH